MFLHAEEQHVLDLIAGRTRLSPQDGLVRAVEAATPKPTAKTGARNTRATGGCCPQKSPPSRRDGGPSLGGAGFLPGLPRDLWPAAASCLQSLRRSIAAGLE